MTRNTNLDPDGQRNADVNRGRVGTSIAGTPGMTYRDGSTTARQIRDLTVVGATLTDNDDGTAVYTIGEGDPGDPGITDHGILTGLGDDDHPQYTTNAEVLALIIANAPGGGEPLTNSNEVNPELIFAGGDVVMVGGGGGGAGAGGVGDDLIDPTSYGALLDCQQVYDAVVTAGTLSTVTSATAGFVSGDTGKTFYLASTAGNVTTGTLTFVNSTTATMSTAAGGAMTGARLIWFTNDIAAWQSALDAAQPGQTVDVASGSFRSGCVGNLNVPAGVNLLRFTGRVFDPGTNPAGNTHGPTFVIGQNAVTEFVTLNRESGFGDGIIYSANQVPPTTASPTTFAAMIATTTSAAGAHIGRPLLCNAYIGIHVKVGRVLIEGAYVGALRRGVIVDFAQDVVTINAIRCHPYWRVVEGMSYTPTAGSLDEYAQNNGRALEINRADALMVGTVFSFGLYGAVLAIDSATEQGVECGYGYIDHVDSDNCVVGIDVWETNTPGLLIHSAFLGSNGTGVGTAGSAGIATQTGGSIAPKVVLKSWSHRGVWSTGASSTGAGTTLIVPSTNPG